MVAKTLFILFLLHMCGQHYCHFRAYQCIYCFEHQNTEQVRRVVCDLFVLYACHKFCAELFYCRSNFLQFDVVGTLQ